MKNKKGFIAISVIFSFFIVFLMLITLNLTSYAQNRILMNQIKTDIKKPFYFITCPNNKSASTKLCKRALNLHIETCEQPKQNINFDNTIIQHTRFCGAAFTMGANINYGNCGVKSFLNIGDAFDCDVNGDGIYDAQTERFYYVSDAYNTNTNTYDTATAVLIFFNNINGKGNISSSNIAENKTIYANVNNISGPTQVIKSLPSTTNWKNIRLKNTTRNILNQKKEIITSNFNYSSYVARLLTIQELSECVNNLENRVVGTSSDNRITGELDKCLFLLENTNFANQNIIDSYWLETPYSNIYNAFTISGSYRMVNSTSVSDVNVGVRPVIEVSKTDIDY